jgi:hypothetical protein
MRMSRDEDALGNREYRVSIKHIHAFSVHA